MPRATLWNRRFSVLLLAQIGVGYANSSFLILPKFLATRLDAGPEAIGRVVLISALSLVVCLFPAGSMVDRHGRKRFLIAGSVLMGLACAAHVFVDAIRPLLYGLRSCNRLPTPTPTPTPTPRAQRWPSMPHRLRASARRSACSGSFS